MTSSPIPDPDNTAALFPGGKFDVVAALNRLAAIQVPDSGAIALAEQHYPVKWDPATQRFLPKP